MYFCLAQAFYGTVPYGLDGVLGLALSEDNNEISYMANQVLYNS